MTSYVIYWDQGLGGSLTALSGSNVNELKTVYLFVSGITSGGNYKFTYAGKNIHGIGPQSDPVVVVAATVPAKMNTPVVTLQPGLKYRVAFAQPSSGGSGVPILSYEILFLQKDGISFTAVAECDGAQQAVLDNHYCEGYLSTLVASPLSLI